MSSWGKALLSGSFWLALTLAALGDGSLRGECLADPQAVRCTCFLSSVETPLTFSEAAGLVEIYHRSQPDEAYEQMVGELLHQCVMDWPRQQPAPPSFTFKTEAPSSRSNLGHEGH